MSTLPFTQPSQAPVLPVRRVAIQGVRGAFHEIAARQFFHDAVEVVPAASFAELVRRAENPSETDAALMAIENSIAGSILGNYNLLKNSRLVITGEIFLPIRQNLLALPGVPIEALTEVHSHPMALAQCAEFFEQHPHLRLIETDDTAAAAARIASHQRREIAAVGSALAAELYGLSVLAPGIETHEANVTRFLVLERGDTALRPAGWGKSRRKISVSFTAPHTSGSLSRILSVLAAQSANLTKIQSVPRVGKVGEYLFFVDFILENPEIIPETLRLLDALTQSCQVLGIYKPGDLA